jgi:hypothetical protein
MDELCWLLFVDKLSALHYIVERLSFARCCFFIGIPQLILSHWSGGLVPCSRISFALALAASLADDAAKK